MYYVRSWRPDVNGVVAEGETKDDVAALRAEADELRAQREREGYVSELREGRPPVLTITVRMALLWVGAGRPARDFYERFGEMSFTEFSVKVARGRAARLERERALREPRKVPP